MPRTVAMSAHTLGALLIAGLCSQSVLGAVNIANLTGV
jgi:hypothetical protein